ncbi:MAG: acyl--CoA ligase, partial [Nitrospirae bacterium]|nr:acyl--CoA ligase [Nitrospirota bacterium]
MTLSALLSERAGEIPDKACIKFEKKKYTYSETDRAVSLTAGGLKELGLMPGERVAILMENCPEYIISYFAILRAGGISVPVNSFLTTNEISYILSDSGCRIIILGKKYYYHLEKIISQVPGLIAVLFDEIPKSTTEPYSGHDDETAVLLYTSGTTGFPKGAMLTHRNLLTNAEACDKV